MHLSCNGPNVIKVYWLQWLLFILGCVRTRRQRLAAAHLERKVWYQYVGMEAGRVVRVDACATIKQKWQSWPHSVKDTHMYLTGHVRIEIPEVDLVRELLGLCHQDNSSQTASAASTCNVTHVL